MKLSDLKEKKELVSTALLAVSVLSAVLIMVKVTGFFVVAAKAESAVVNAIEHSKPDSENVAAQVDKFKKVADALKKSNLFAPPATKQNPIKAVMGIFGDEALINGKWYKAGDKVADAKILAVNPTSVETEWDGKKKTFSPIDGGATSSPGTPSRGRSTASTRRSSSSSGKGAQIVVTKSDAGTKSTKSGKEKKSDAKKTSQIYKSLSDSQRDMVKRVLKDRAEQFKQMNGDEKARFKAHVIERISHSGKR